MPLEPDDPHHLGARTPRFRWLDRWLEPRWRALLTWVVLAALATWLTRSPIAADIDVVVSFAQQQLLRHVPITIQGPISGPLSVIPSVATFAFMQLWFEPIVLRLGIVRSIIWMAVGTGCRTVYGVVNWDLAAWSVVAAFALSGLAAGVPGLTVAGRRNRPWMALIAGSVSTLWTGSFYVSQGGRELGFDLGELSTFVESIVASVLYGAVMLYGTDPLPRRPAE